MKRKVTIVALALAAALFAAADRASAVITYGTLDNFDVINDTMGECHGFEIELEGLQPADVVYTFGAPYQRYGDPTIVPTANGVIIRYAAAYDIGTKTWSATTPYTAPPYLPTQGHSCWTMGVPDPIQYFSCGCDHFGASLNATPTKTTYRWLIEGAPGTLTQFGSNAQLPAPVWNVTPQPPPMPGLPPPPPIVAAAIMPPAPDVYEFGDALWVKIFVTELPNGLQSDDLNHLVVDDPEVDIVPNEPAEVEIEWVLLQASTENDGEQEFGAEVGADSEAVSRRFEFYKYVGEYDAETHEAVCDNPDVCPDAVGDIIGAQNVAINLAGLLGPTVSMASVAANPTNASPIPVTVTFSQPVTDFAAADIIATNATVGDFSGAGADYAFTLTPTGQGLVTADIPADAAINDSALPNQASETFSRTYDSLPPTAVILLTDASPTNANAVHFTVDFAGALAPGSFTASDITVNGLAGSVLVSPVLPGTVYPVTVTLADPGANGSVGITIGTQVFDKAGNAFAGLASALYTIDNGPPPTVTMDSVLPDLTNTSPIPVSVTFSEAVTDFVAGDIIPAGATVGDFAGGGASYTFTLTPTGQGTVTANIPAGVAVNGSAVGNQAAPAFTRTFDSLPPTAVILLPDSSPTDANAVHFNVDFAGALMPGSFTVADVTVNGLAGTAVVGLVQPGTVYPVTVTLSDPSANGTVGISIGTQVFDKAGNPFAGLTSATYTITNGGGPLVTLTSATADPTNASPILVSAKFSESVTGFEVGDIAATGATVGGFSGAGTDYTFTLTPTGQGTVTASIPASAAINGAAVGNQASLPFSRTYDSLAPTAVILLPDASSSNADVVHFTVDFAGALTPGSFTAADITVNGLAGTVVVGPVQPGTVYPVTVTLSDPNANGTVGITIGTQVFDKAGNAFAGLTSATYTISN